MNIVFLSLHPRWSPWTIMWICLPLLDRILDVFSPYEAFYPYDSKCSRGSIAGLFLPQGTCVHGGWSAVTVEQVAILIALGHRVSVKYLTHQLNETTPTSLSNLARYWRRHLISNSTICVFFLIHQMNSGSSTIVRSEWPLIYWWASCLLAQSRIFSYFLYVVPCYHCHVGIAHNSQPDHYNASVTVAYHKHGVPQLSYQKEYSPRCIRTFGVSLNEGSGGLHIFRSKFYPFMGQQRTNCGCSMTCQKMHLVSVFQRDHETSTNSIRVPGFEHKIVVPALSIAPRATRVGLRLVQNFRQLLIMCGWTKRNDAPSWLWANLVQAALFLIFWGRQRKTEQKSSVPSNFTIMDPTAPLDGSAVMDL